MLDYIKLILQKVSFDKKLFEKELRKAIARLMPKEVVELKKWCYQHFSNTYYLTLDRCFTVSMV